MHAYTRLSFIVALIVAFCGAYAPAVSYAQSGTPPTTCDSHYGSDAAPVVQSVDAMLKSMGTPDAQFFSNATTSKVISDISPLAVSLIKARVEYEEAPVLAGCEDVRMAVIQYAMLHEDYFGLAVATLTDTKNATDYIAFLGTTWPQRLQAFNASLSGTPAAPAPQSNGTCSDAAFQKRVQADFASLLPHNPSDVSSYSPVLFSAIKLRYQYEDMADPANCDAARADFVQILSSAEDAYLMAILNSIDTANSSTYNGLMDSTVLPHASKLSSQLWPDLGVPQPTQPASS